MSVQTFDEALKKERNGSDDKILSTISVIILQSFDQAFKKQYGSDDDDTDDNYLADLWRGVEGTQWQCGLQQWGQDATVVGAGKVFSIGIERPKDQNILL